MPVVELLELSQRVEEVAFVPDQSTVEELAPAGLHPPFHDRVHSRHPDAAEYDLDTRVREDSVERGGECRVPVTDHELRPRPRVLQIHDEIAPRLHHPGRGRMRGGPQDPDPAAGVLEHGEHV